MDKSFFKTESGKKIIKVICIIASYAVFYGLFIACIGFLNNNTVAFAAFIIICMIFAYKSSKGYLVNTLSSLPWPLFLSLVLLLSALIGCFTAPYHIGKWVAEKI